MNVLHSLSIQHGLPIVSVCAYDVLIPHMTDSARLKLIRKIAHPQSVIVALFPYWSCATRPGNLSIYARGQDYHQVAGQRLEALAVDLRSYFDKNNFIVLVDDSPLPEVIAAASAGLGVIGQHGLLIHPIYGSYVFIGTIVTDFILDTPSYQLDHCLQCGICRRACPVGLNKSDCLSALTQQGGTLTDQQAAYIRAHPLIWGCDTCQLVCPMNQQIQPCNDPMFTQDCIDTLNLSDLDGLTRKQFTQKYPSRAFTWRGPAPLRRNLSLKQGE